MRKASWRTSFDLMLGSTGAQVGVGVGNIVGVCCKLLWPVPRVSILKTLPGAGILARIAYLFTIGRLFLLDYFEVSTKHLILLAAPDSFQLLGFGGKLRTKVPTNKLTTVFRTVSISTRLLFYLIVCWEIEDKAG